MGTDGTSTAYFRGRKLRANNVPVPEGYEGRLTAQRAETRAQCVLGVVLQLTDETIPSSAGEQDCLVTSKSHANDYRDDGEDEEGEEEEEEEEDLKVMEQVASFGDIAVWGHELVPSDEENPYQKAVTEWATFAGKVRCNEGNSLCMAANVTRRYIPTTLTTQ